MRSRTTRRKPLYSIRRGNICSFHLSKSLLKTLHNVRILPAEIRLLSFID